MNLNTYNQLFSLFIFILTGIIIGVLFDFFRIIRRSFKTPDWMTCIEDITFWILAGLILLFTIFTFNSGEIRIYVFVGIIFGLSIYLLTLSKYFIKISVIILTFIKKIIYYPIKVLYKIIKNFIFRPFSFVFKSIKVIITTKLLKKSNKKTENANLQ